MVREEEGWVRCYWRCRFVVGEGRGVASDEELSAVVVTCWWCQIYLRPPYEVVELN